jgi:DNA-directed RNA polymerase subunit RPC12/RpoP
MAEKVKYRCKNCGNRFEVEILSDRERREFERQNRPTSPVRCPGCKRTDVMRGWY